MITIASFIEQFHLFMDKRKSTSDIVCLRSIIGSEEEALLFVEEFSKLTGTDWVPHLGRPHSRKFIFQKTWLCHRSWCRKSEFHSQDSNCSAKIDILLKKANPSTFENDIYVNHKPPLHCVIHLTGKHNHDSENGNGFQMAGLSEEMKEHFFEYFQSGLTVTKARRKHEMFLTLMKNSDKVTFRSNPTLRQIQHLYNYWKSLKSRIGSLKEKDKQEEVTLKELFNAIPTMDIPQESNQAPLELQMKSPSSASKNVQPPLVFVSTGSTGALSNKTAPLLYKLKYGPDDTFMSSLTIPEIYSIVVNSPALNSLNGQLPNPENTSEISVKIEPPDSDEDTGTTSMNSENERVQDGLIMPVVIKAYSCEVDSLNPNASPQSLDLQNGAGECIFPLVFAYAGLAGASTDPTTPFLYELKQGPFGLNVTPETMPQIFSVQINSTSQANLRVNNDSTLNTELPLKVCLQVENIKNEVEDLNTVSSNLQNDNETSKMPVILEVSSCKAGGKFVGLPQNYDKAKSCSLIPNSIGVGNSHNSLATGFSSGANRVCVKEQDPTIDDDHKFCMSLLPLLQQLPRNQKLYVKKKIQDIVIASRLCASKIEIEKRRSNIYRDCGVLPALRDWRF